MLIDYAKMVVKRTLPPRMHRALRQLWTPEVRAASHILHELERENLFVRSGPFEGMKYVKDAVGSELTPKLIGTYELELNATISEAFEDAHDGIIDIGAAEGYYAVGAALRTSSTEIIAFESDSRGRSLLRQMAGLNGVAERIQIRETCSPAELNAVTAQFNAPFVLCDCEGGELELLDPAGVPALRRATMLVEVHGRVEVPSGAHPDHPAAMGALLAARFAASHSIEFIPIRQRTLDDWPAALAAVGEIPERVPAMHEFRSPGPGWMSIKPKPHVES